MIEHSGCLQVQSSVGLKPANIELCLKMGINGVETMASRRRILRSIEKKQ